MRLVRFYGVEMNYYSLKIFQSEAVNYEEDIVSDLKSECRDAKNIIAELRSQCKDASISLNVDGEINNKTTWHNPENILIKFSQKYPDKLFVLLRKGQVLGDIQEYYFREGNFRVYWGEVNFPYFNDVDKIQFEEYSDNLPNIEPLSYEEGCHFFLKLENASGEEIFYLRRGYPEARAALDKYGNFFKNKKWHNLESNLVDFSRKYPKTTFTFFCGFRRRAQMIKVNNMNNLEKFWRKDFKNGKVHRSSAFWSFDHFNGGIYADNDNTDIGFILIKNQKLSAKQLQILKLRFLPMLSYSEIKNLHDNKDSELDIFESYESLLKISEIIHPSIALTKIWELQAERKLPQFESFQSLSKISDFLNDYGIINIVVMN